MRFTGRTLDYYGFSHSECGGWTERTTAMGMACHAGVVAGLRDGLLVEEARTQRLSPLTFDLVPGLHRKA